MKTHPRRWICRAAAVLIILVGVPSTRGEPDAKERAGASHWAFRPPERPQPPKVQQSDWPRNPIDSFILARLEKSGLEPAPPASKARLIRRLTLDLTGLPPEVEAVDAFLNDASPNAYQQVIDRLLASPGYGERMALPWLEAARYADTDGYQNDGFRQMWRWRDWVINAYNENLPFDRFTILQLAGDMLPEATLEERIATGFNRNHRANSEGGLIPEEWLVEYVADRVETTSTVWMGLTLGCARCHDHKYDPISQKEFYEMSALFNNVPDRGRAIKHGNTQPLMRAPTAAQQQKLERLAKEVAEAEEALAAHKPEIRRAQRRWEAGLGAQEDFNPPIERGLVAHFSFDRGGKDRTKNAASPEFREGEPRFVSGRIGSAVYLPGTTHLNAGQVADFHIQAQFTMAAWIRPEAIEDEAILSRMQAGPERRGYEFGLEDGRLQSKIITRWVSGVTGVATKEKLAPDEWYHVAVRYDGSMSARGLSLYVNGEKQAVEITYNTSSNTPRTPGVPLRIGARPGEAFFDGVIDDVRLYDRMLAPEEIAILANPDSIRTIAAIPPHERSAIQSAKIRRHFLAHHAPESIRRLRHRQQAAKKRKRELEETLPTVMVMKESEDRRPTYVLERGEYDKPGEEVRPGVPDALMSDGEKQPASRLEFARWLVEADHPLTARVAVNRYWQMYFGRGLVKTVEDFGTRGERPSHPELLDWLATEFVRSGWDIKQMQRLIVSSATYRQNSRVTPAKRRRDPENRLLSRGPRLRLSAQAIRDQALAAGGLLTHKSGGPSVKPYQPEGLWEKMANSGRYEPDEGDALYRRSLYTFWKRTVAPPTMAMFDAAKREICRVRSPRTSTPLQALALMNEKGFVEAARKLGERMIREGGKSASERVRFGFRALLARAPRPGEQERLLDGYHTYLKAYRRDPDAARQLLAVGGSPADESLDAAELAACTMVANTILNLDETVTKE